CARPEYLRARRCTRPAGPNSRARRRRRYRRRADAFGTRDPSTPAPPHARRCAGSTTRREIPPARGSPPVRSPSPRGRPRAPGLARQTPPAVSDSAIGSCTLQITVPEVDDHGLIAPTRVGPELARDELHVVRVLCSTRQVVGGGIREGELRCDVHDDA